MGYVCVCKGVPFNDTSRLVVAIIRQLTPFVRANWEIAVKACLKDSSIN